jgi:hypothetical protein
MTDTARAADVVDAFRGDHEVYQPRLPLFPDSFADHPLTIGELRAEREQSGSSWRPRDALIELLRMIDQGKVAPDTIFIAYSESPEPGARRTSFTCAGPDPNVTLGCLERAKHHYLRQVEVGSSE